VKCNVITIVGLGLIGGSLLKALQGFDEAIFYGVDAKEEVVAKAKEQGLIQYCESNEKALMDADVVYVCLPPDAVPDFINNHQFKKGSLVTDVCGVKQTICDRITNPDVDFIGGHPMAGKEASGFDASDGELFKNASYLLTPTEHNQPEHIELLKRIIEYIGCRETVITNPKEHDEMIAYTSQLMHVVAIALCDNRQLDKAKSFSAGSLRDCTRVAKLDSKLWTQLFMHNKKELSNCIDVFEESMNKIKRFLQSEDAEGLQKYLEEISHRKQKFLA